MQMIPTSKNAWLTALAALQLMWFGAAAMAQSGHTLRSPDRRIEIQVRAGDRLRYSVLVNGKAVLLDSTLSLKIDQQTLGLDPKIKVTRERKVDQEIAIPVPRKASLLREAYNELRLEMQGDYAVVFRAYNEGVAYRWETTLAENEVKVHEEEVSFNFPGDYNVYYPREDSFFSHNERKFLYLPLKEIAPGAMASLPAVVDTNGTKLVIADSDVEDYPGLWLRGKSNNSLSGIFPPYPLKEELTRDRDFKVTQTADYIAVTRGKRTYPRRIVGIAEKDGDLIANQIVYLLAGPSQIQDTSWIRPGKVAWD